MVHYVLCLQIFVRKYPKRVVCMQMCWKTHKSFRKSNNKIEEGEKCLNLNIAFNY